MTQEQWKHSSSTHPVGAYFERRINVPIRYEYMAFRYDPKVNYAADVSVDFKSMNAVCQIQMQRQYD